MGNYEEAVARAVGNGRHHIVSCVSIAVISLLSSGMLFIHHVVSSNESYWRATVVDVFRLFPTTFHRVQVLNVPISRSHAPRSVPFLRIFDLGWRCFVREAVINYDDEGLVQCCPPICMLLI